MIMAGCVATLIASQVQQQLQIGSLQHRLAQRAVPAVAAPSAQLAQTLDVPSCPLTFSGQFASCVLMPASATAGVGQEITAPPLPSPPGTQWLITDGTGAPMAWNNLFGLFTGGSPGTVGGLICTTSGLAKAACLEPDTGEVALFSSAGTNPELLTRQDIIWLHNHDHQHGTLPFRAPWTARP